MLDRDYLDGLIDELQKEWMRLEIKPPEMGLLIVGACKLRDAILAAPEPPMDGDLISRKAVLGILYDTHELYRGQTFVDVIPLQKTISFIESLPSEPSRLSDLEKHMLAALDDKGE